MLSGEVLKELALRRLLRKRSVLQMGSGLSAIRTTEACRGHFSTLSCWECHWCEDQEVVQTHISGFIIQLIQSYNQKTTVQEELLSTWRVNLRLISVAAETQQKVFTGPPSCC